MVVVPPRFEAYTEASKAVFDVFHDTTPLVEGMSIDEAFLDVGGLRRIAGTPAAIAARLRSRRAATGSGLPITVGVARTKFLAKVASGVAKPDGLLVVEPDGELEFLHPLPVGRLWGVGPVTERKLHDRGIRTVGEVAVLGEAHLVGDARRRLGSPPPRAGPQPRSAAGRHRQAPRLDRFAAGARSRSEVARRRSRRCCSASSTASPAGCATPAGSGRTVTVRLRFDDFTRATRARSLPHPTAATEPIRDGGARGASSTPPT